MTRDDASIISMLLFTLIFIFASSFLRRVTFFVVQIQPTRLFLPNIFYYPFVNNSSIRGFPQFIYLVLIDTKLVFPAISGYDGSISINPFHFKRNTVSAYFVLIININCSIGGLQQRRAKMQLLQEIVFIKQHQID